MQSIELSSANGARIAARVFAATRAAPKATVLIAAAMGVRQGPRPHRRRIGHFGFFRAQFEATLWTRVTTLFQRFDNGALA
jgi:predicted alpha/beta hydrolase